MKIKTDEFLIDKVYEDLRLKNPKVARLKRRKESYLLKTRRLKVTKFFQSDENFDPSILEIKY